MKASATLKRQIIIEILALLFLIGAVIYSVFAIKKSGENKINTTDALVSVIDDTKMDSLEIKSDGEGLNGHGTIYNITNNNDKAKNYSIVIIPNIHNVKVLENIKISIDDIYIKDLSSLDRKNGGYIIINSALSPGYTKSYLIKAWYKKDAPEDIATKKVKFDYKVIVSDKE